MDLDEASTLFDYPDELYDHLQSHLSKKMTELSEDLPDLEVPNEEVTTNGLATDMEHQCKLLRQKM